jgi:hypothetical protein
LPGEDGRLSLDQRYGDVATALHAASALCAWRAGTQGERGAVAQAKSAPARVTTVLDQLPPVTSAS